MICFFNTSFVFPSLVKKVSKSFSGPMPVLSHSRFIVKYKMQDGKSGRRNVCKKIHPIGIVLPNFLTYGLSDFFTTCITFVKCPNKKDILPISTSTLFLFLLK